MLLEKIRQFLDGDSAVAAQNALDDLLERFQLVPKAEYQRHLQQLRQLEDRVTELEGLLSQETAD